VHEYVDRSYGASEKEEADPEVIRLFDGLERLILESKMRPLEPERLDPLTWELLLLWKGREQEHQRLYMQRLAEAHMPTGQV
jgi:hypothetical protein